MIQAALSAEPDPFRILGAATRLALYIAALGAVGLALFDLGFGGRAGAGRDWLRRVIPGTAAAGAVAALLWLAAQVGIASAGDPLDPDVWAMMPEMPPGRSVALAVVGLLLVGGAGWLGRVAPLAQAVGAVSVAASFTLVGHTTNHPPRALLAALLVVHLLGAAFWAGSLLPLARASRGAPPEAAALVEAWAKAAAVLVAVLVATGAVLSWAIVGNFQTLFGTRYGWALISKVALVGTLLGFAAWHKYRLTPDLASGRPGAGRRLASSIAWEGAVMLLVFWAVSELTATSPSGDA